MPKIAHLAPSTIAELNQYAVAYEIDTPDRVVQFISLQLLLGCRRSPGLMLSH